MRVKHARREGRVGEPSREQSALPSSTARKSHCLTPVVFNLVRAPQRCGLELLSCEGSLLLSGEMGNHRNPEILTRRTASLGLDGCTPRQRTSFWLGHARRRTSEKPSGQKIRPSRAKGLADQEARRWAQRGDDAVDTGATGPGRIKLKGSK